MNQGIQINDIIGQYSVKHLLWCKSCKCDAANIHNTNHNKLYRPSWSFLNALIQTQNNRFQNPYLSGRNLTSHIIPTNLNKHCLVNVYPGNFL